MHLDVLSFTKQLIYRCISVNAQRVQSTTLDSLFSSDASDLPALINNNLKSSLLEYFKQGNPSSICTMITPVHTQYCILCFSNEPEDYLMLGPFLDHMLSENTIYSVIESLCLTIEHASDLKLYYQSLPIIDTTNVLEILYLVHEYFTQSTTPPHCFTLDRSILPEEDTSYESISLEIDRTAMYKSLEQRYANEDKMLSYITNGDFIHAQECWKNSYKVYQSIVRTKDSLRNSKNLMVIANTLYRKAAQAGGVHPIYLDELSGKWAIRIEQATSLDVFPTIPLQMIRSYCLLVKNKSLANFSPIVKQAITYINLNLGSSLTVKEIASEVGVSPDYLTRLFKKELDTTVIAYINRKRIQSSLKLLNSTDLCIQDIGDLVGLSDTSYFNKLFKKYIGIPPKQYRDSLK